MTELLHHHSEDAADNSANYESSDLAVERCIANFKQTSRDVVQRIEDSGYRYGLDSLLDTPQHWDGGADQSAWQLGHFDVWDKHEKETVRLKLFLAENGKIALRRKDDFTVHTYVPRLRGESDEDIVRLYVNLVELVEDDEFRQERLAFLAAEG